MPVGKSRDEIHLDGIFGESGRMLKKKWRRVKRHLDDKWMPDYLKANLDMDPSKRVSYGDSEDVPKAKRPRPTPKLRIRL